MSEQILGLPTTAKFAAEEDLFFNHRRKILHQYPQGSAPLTGILSMIAEEVTSSHQFFWYEKRYISPRTQTRGTNPLTTDAPSDGDANDGTNLPAGAVTVTTVLFLKVAATRDFRAGYILELAGLARLQFQVIAVVPGVADTDKNGYVEVRSIRAYTATATDDTADTLVRAMGTAYGEGAPGQGIKPLGFRRPFRIDNQTHISRTPFDFSGTVLQEGLKYDDTGPYKERARDAVVEHMTAEERSLIFSRRSTTTRPSLAGGTNEDEVVRTSMGIIEFLEMWDAGDVGLQIDGSTTAFYNFKTQSVSDSDDEKRIIENSDGFMSVDRFNGFAERVGRKHTNKSNEKLVLCGSGAILAYVKMFRNSSHFNVSVNQSAYGLKFITLHTPFGDFHFMTHPLFSDDPEWRFWSLILDIHSLKYRPLTNRDTHIRKMQQNPRDDKREDAYLTEAGYEFWMPENNMLIKNVRDFKEE